MRHTEYRSKFDGFSFAHAFVGRLAELGFVFQQGLTFFREAVFGCSLRNKSVFKEDLEIIFGKRPFDKEELPLIKADSNISPSAEVKIETKVEDLSADKAGKKEEPKAEEKKPEEKKSEEKKDGEPEKPLNTLF